MSVEDDASRQQPLTLPDEIRADTRRQEDAMSAVVARQDGDNDVLRIERLTSAELRPRTPRS